MRKLVEAELLQSGQEARQLLPPEGAEHHLAPRAARRPATASIRISSGEIGMIDVFDRAVGGNIGCRANS